MSINHHACILLPDKRNLPGRIVATIGKASPGRHHHDTREKPVQVQSGRMVATSGKPRWPGRAASPRAPRITHTHTHTHLHLVTWKGDATPIGRYRRQRLPSTSTPGAAAHIIIVRPAASGAVEAVPRIARSTTPPCCHCTGMRRRGTFWWRARFRALRLRGTGTVPVGCPAEAQESGTCPACVSYRRGVTDHSLVDTTTSSPPAGRRRRRECTEHRYGRPIDTCVLLVLPANESHHMQALARPY